MTTKEQERKALEQIRKIVENLGEDSYIATAFDGCFEIAEENIENDFACSMKQRYERASEEAASFKAQASESKKQIEKLTAQLERLTAQLDRELEWKEYEMEENVKQADYENLTKQSDTRFLSDDEAKEIIYDWYGFAKEKTTIHNTVPKYEVNRHGQLRKIGDIERKPAYNATDWNYIRFDCGAMTYELYNDNLSFFYH